MPTGTPEPGLVVTDQPAGPDEGAELPPDREGQRRPSAGRDLRAATAVGLGLATLAVGTLFLYPPAFAGLVVAVMVVAVWELTHAFAVRGIAVPLVPALIGTVLMLVGAFVSGTSPMVVGLALTVVAIAVWRLGENAHGYVRDVSAGVFISVYVPFLAGFAMLMARGDDGQWQVFALLAVVAASDVGGYATGVLIGKHPMARSVSPKKTWEGLGGSLVLGICAGLAVATLTLDAPWWTGVLLGVVGVLGATVGDLGESMIKRDLGIKDMSALLPGHGGVMDRLDSLLATAPLVWLVITYVA